MRKRERSRLNSTDFVFLISLARQSSVYSFSILSRFDFFMCQRPRLDMFTGEPGVVQQVIGDRRVSQDFLASLTLPSIPDLPCLLAAYYMYTTLQTTSPSLLCYHLVQLSKHIHRSFPVQVPSR